MTQNVIREGWQLTLTNPIAIGMLALSGNGALAQISIIPDNTLGNERSVVTPVDAQRDRINGGAIRNTNLFHSFGAFSIPERRTVEFSNPSGIRNIFSRVTGSDPSNLLGTLRVLGDANFYLLNPNGILFGSNARLDLKGSFTASTASSITFPDGSQFSARNPQAPSLLVVDVVAPVGLQFEGQPGIITNRGNLSAGQDLTLAASNLDLEGQLQAGGNITLQALSSIELKGKDTRVSTSVEKGTTEKGGVIRIDARSLTVSDNAQLRAETQGTGDAGDVEIDVHDVVKLEGNGTRIRTTVESSGTGKGGNIHIDARLLYLAGGAQLQAGTNGKGNAGNVRIKTHEAVILDGKGSDSEEAEISTKVRSDSGVGNAGVIEIRTGSLFIQNGAQLSAASQGNGEAGDVKISARGSVVLDGSRIVKGNRNPHRSAILTEVTSRSRGNSGNIEISAGSLSMSNGGRIETETSSEGNAGNVVINVRDTVALEGVGTTILAAVGSKATGKGGDIRINARLLSISDNAQLQAQTNGLGDAGSIILGSAQQFIEQLIVKNGSNILVDSRNSSPAGNITVSANVIFLDRGDITAITRSTDGGNITLNVRDLLLMHHGSQISTTAGTAQAGGNGGNITINANDGFMIAVPKENSDIAANAFTGKGGRVEITAQGIFGIHPRLRLTPLSDITASSEFGAQGIVETNTGIDPSQSLNRLPDEQRSPELAEGCQTNSGQQAAQFFNIGKGGLPPRPEDPLNADFLEWSQDHTQSTSKPEPSTLKTSGCE